MSQSDLHTLEVLLNENYKLSDEVRVGFLNSIDSVVSEYKKLEGIQSIVVGGSVARRLADNKSDIEMYVYTHNQLPSEVNVKEIIDNLGAVMTRSSDLIWQHKIWGPHTFFAIDGINFELGYRILPKIKAKIKKYLVGEDIYSHHTKEADTPFGHYTSGIAFCVKSSVILYEDESKKLSTLKKELEEFPKELKRKIFDYYFNEAYKMLSVKLRSSSYRNDDLAYNAQLASIIRSMNICLFTLNSTHFPGDKWNFDFINQFKIKPVDYEPMLKIVLNELNTGAQNKCYKYVLLERLLEKINQISAGVIR